MIRIKHTPSETYKVYSLLPCKSILFKNVKRWYLFKHYRTKQSALAAIKRFREKFKDDSIKKDLIFKIVWSPYPFASDDECITVYNEDGD